MEKTATKNYNSFEIINNNVIKYLTNGKDEIIPYSKEVQDELIKDNHNDWLKNKKTQRNIEKQKDKYILTSSIFSIITIFLLANNPNLLTFGLFLGNIGIIGLEMKLYKKTKKVLIKESEEIEKTRKTLENIIPEEKTKYLSVKKALEQSDLFEFTNLQKQELRLIFYLSNTDIVKLEDYAIKNRMNYASVIYYLKKYKETLDNPTLIPEITALTEFIGTKKLEKVLKEKVDK